jgi:hypothetical protein
MMKPTDVRDGNNLASSTYWLRRPRNGAILVERIMRTAAIIVVGVRNQYPAQMIFAHDNHMVEALSADGPNYPLGIYVLPRRLLSRDVLINA